MAGHLVAGLDTTPRAVPSSMDLENPPPAAGVDDDLERQRLTEVKKAKVKAFLITLVISLVITACIVILLMLYMPDERYSVAIDSASSLDSRTGVSFNLTLGVTSGNHGKACIDTRMYVEVLYRGVQVAASNPAGTRRTCAGRPNMAEMPMVARATMQPVGDMLDRLAKELGQGAALFDLRLVVPSTAKGGKPYLAVSRCKASRVGDAAVPCGSPTYT